jgi:hypothetical protein
MRLALTLMCATLLPAQFSTPTQPDCGTYTLVTIADGTFACERYAAFPWFAAGQGWSTQISMFTAPESGQQRGVQFQIGLGPGASVQAVEGGLAGNSGTFSFVQPPVLAGSSARLDILSALDTTVLAYGPLSVQLDAPDVQTLEAANLQLIFLFADSTGKYNTQLAVPPIFNDQATSSWISSFSETPIDRKAASANSNDCSFAVANLSAQPQSVTVSLYNQSGILIAQNTTPLLTAGIPGGVYGIDFGTFFGLTSSALTSPTGTIDGTVQFASSAGLPIAPLVIRQAGNSVSTFQVTPLRPFTAPVE